MIKSLLLSAVFSLPIFSDGFEANASTCWSGVKSVDTVNDALAPVLVKSGALVCLDRAVVKFDCQLVNGQCKRDEPPVVTPPTPVCKPLPSGFVVIEKPWKTLVGNTYPNSPSWLQPIGSWTERTGSSPGGKPAAGKVYTASFVADSANHKISWLGAQRVDNAGYGTPQVATEVYVAISPCRGDLQAACSNRAKSSALFYGKVANVPACALTPGQKYYLNVGFFPRNLDPKTNTCSALNSSGGVRCDANFSAY